MVDAISLVIIILASSFQDALSAVRTTTELTTPFPHATRIANLDNFTFPNFSFRPPTRKPTTQRWAFCQSTVFSECFGKNDGTSRQICGFSSNAPRVITPNSHVGKDGCNQNTRILQLLQAKGDDWNSDAVRYELQLSCPSFRETQKCLESYNSQCAGAYKEYGLSTFVNHFSYICYQEGAFALVSYYNCLKYVRTQDDEDAFYGDCVKYATKVIDLDFKTINVTDDMDEDTCGKFKAFVGCKAYQLTQKCGGNVTAKNMTISRAAARFFLAALATAQKGAVGNQTCYVASAEDVDLAILAFVNYTPKTSTTLSTTTRTKTTTSTTTKTTTRITRTMMARRNTQRPTTEDSESAAISHQHQLMTWLYFIIAFTFLFLNSIL